MKINDYVRVVGYTPTTCHMYSVWRIEYLTDSQAVIAMVKPWTVTDHRWNGELAQVEIAHLEIYEGSL